MARATGGRRASSRRLSTARVGFSLPALLWYGLFMIGPLVAMFVISTLDWGGFLATPEAAGLANYRKVFADEDFWTAARNSVLQLVVVLPIMLPTSFMLGYFLTLRRRGHGALRIIFFTPALISLAALGAVFYAVFQPQGLLNAGLTSVGLRSLATPWLANDTTALPAIMLVNLWSGIGFTAILFSTRLASVPGEVYEAASLDGCGHWRTMWLIAYPIIKGYFGVLSMLQFLWVLFASAGLILILTRGGPGTSSTTLAYLMYDKAFVESEIGYSQAVGVVLFAIGLVGMLVIRRTFRDQT